MVIWSFPVGLWQMGAEGESRDTKRGICSGTYLHDQGWGGRAVHSGRHQQKSDAGLSYFRCWRVKSSTVVLKTLHSEETEWGSSFGTCYKILLYVKGQGWGGTAKGTPSFQPQPLTLLQHTCTCTRYTHTDLQRMENHNQTFFADPTLTYFYKYNTRLYIYLSLIRTYTHTCTQQIYTHQFTWLL